MNSWSIQFAIVKLFVCICIISMSFEFVMLVESKFPHDVDNKLSYHIGDPTFTPATIAPAIISPKTKR